MAALGAGGLLWVGMVAECVDEVGDLVVLFQGVAQWVLGTDDVVVLSTLFASFDASDVLEVGEDLSGGAPVMSTVRRCP